MCSSDLINGLATDYDFKDQPINPATPPAITGEFKNQSLNTDFTNVGVTVVNTSGTSFSLSDSNCPATLTAINNNTCSFTVTFNPGAGTAGIDQIGRLEVAADITGSPEVRNLFGRGVAPAEPGLRVTIAGGPPYLLFESQTLYTASAQKTISVQNTGSVALTVTSASLSNGAGDYTLPNPNACASIAAGGHLQPRHRLQPHRPRHPARYGDHRHQRAQQRHPERDTRRRGRFDQRRPADFYRHREQERQ